MPDKENVVWVKVNTVSASGTTMEEYVNQDGTLCKQVWDDGFEEIFETVKLKSRRLMYV